MTKQTDGKSPAHVLRRGSPAAKALRVGALFVLVALLVYGILVLAAPYLVSNGVVRAALERSVSNWTGQRTVIGGAPEIRFWPEPRIVLPSVQIVARSGDEEKPLGTIESLSARFGLIQAIRGRPAFSDFRLERPVLSMERDAGGRTAWAGGGILGEAIRAARAGEPRASEPGNGIGTATVVDGTVSFSDQTSGNNSTFTGVGGTLEWEDLSGALSAKLTGSLDGRRFRIELSSPEPLTLFSGGNADVAMTVLGDGLTANFDGIASFGESYFLSGPLALEVADMSGFLDWLGWKPRTFENWKEAAIAGTLVTMGKDLQLSDLKASLNGNKASGILDLTFPADGKPRLGGTLAFDRVDLSALLDAFALLPDSPTGARATSRLRQSIDVDVTLSARQAVIGALALEEMAASLFAVGEKRQFEIVDSQIVGGVLTAGLDDASADANGGLRIAIRNADLGMLAERLALSGPLPRARGSLDLNLRFAKPLAMLSPRDLGGTLTFHADEGSLQPLDIGGVRRLAGEQSFFRLSEAGDGSLDFTAIDVEATITGASARIEEAAIVAPDGTLSFRGIVPYTQNSMALAAHWQANPRESRGGSLPDRLFVAGSWPDPIISPIAQPQPDVLK